LLFLGQVGVGHAGGKVAGNGASRLAYLALGLVDQAGQQPEGRRQVGLGDARPTGAGEQRAVTGHQGQVALAVPAVDGDDRGQGAAHRMPAGSAHGRYARFSSISRSVSCPARSYWPTSGCASSAASTRSRPPRSAASTASSSYPATWPTSPLSCGSSGATGTGWAPAAPTVDGTSMTASSGRNASVPALRTFTTWVSRPSVTSDASSATAASE